MQSLRRQIKRGNACMCFNRFTNEVYVSKKKGSPSFKNLNGEMVKSFDMVQLGAFNIFAFDGIQIAIDEIKRMFAFAFSFAFPLFFIAFILDIYYGYGTKSMPAFSPFIVTFQLKFLLVFLFMMFGFEIFVQSFKDYFIAKFS